MELTIKLGGRAVGPGQAPYVIAEIGSNHNGDMALCRRLIDAAVTAGVDAVKFQSFSIEGLLARQEYSGQDGFFRDVERYRLMPDQHRTVKAYCDEKGVTFCSTPFSAGEVDLLEEVGAPFFKIASMDVNNPALLRYVARKKRPIVLATGMATLGEIERAVEMIRGEGNEQLVLLHCVSLYPPAYGRMNLRNIEMLHEVFGLPVGFSDHTLGIGCPLAAIALGACVIEKHFTLDKKLEGWDHAVSADAAEMAAIVREGRAVWESLGRYERVVSSEEVEKRAAFRRSLVTKRAMKAGELLSERDVGFKRPGTGIPPDEVQFAVGRKLVEDLAADQVVRWSHLDRGAAGR
jgi:N,N'-diacetyllegionaminate synthase